MILICVKLVNQVESCPRKHHIHTQNVLMCFLEIANNSTFVHPGKCEGSLFVWPQQRERQWLQKSFLMTLGLWAPELTNTTELRDFTSTLTAGMCVRESLYLYLWMYSALSRSDIYSGTWKSSQRFELEHRGQIRSFGSVSSASDETCWEPLQYLLMTSTARTKGWEGVRMLSYSSLIGSPGSTGRGFRESDWCTEPEVDF